MGNISDECIIGLDTMKMFKMVLDVGILYGGSKWESADRVF